MTFSVEELTIMSLIGKNNTREYLLSEIKFFIKQLKPQDDEIFKVVNTISKKVEQITDEEFKNLPWHKSLAAMFERIS